MPRALNKSLILKNSCEVIGFIPIFQMEKLRSEMWGTWVAHSVERLTLDFSSGHDLIAREIEPHVGLCADSTEPAWDSLSSSFTVPVLAHAHVLSHTRSLSVSLSNFKNRKEKWPTSSQNQDLNSELSNYPVQALYISNPKLS